MGLFSDVTTDMLEFGGGADWYPKGDYEVALDKVYTQDLPSSPEGEPYRGYVTTEGEQVSIQFGDFTPNNGADAPPGNNKAFLKIVLRDGEMGVVNVDPKDENYTELAKGKRRLASLAEALEVTYDDPQDFIDDLKAGVFNGSRLMSTWVRWARGGREGSYPSKFAPITLDVGATF